MFVIRRNPHNPVLSPHREHHWEAQATFNPSVVREAGGWRMYYRALANPAAIVAPFAPQSSIGEAFSEDGVHFSQQRQVLAPTEPWEAFGCEDPRVTDFEGARYLAYTALGGYPFSKDNIKVAIAVSHDEGKTFSERHLVTPFNAKAFTLFPERVNGKVAALLAVHSDDPPTEICLALADRVEEFWDPRFWEQFYADWKSHAILMRRSDNDHVEVGTTPLLTEHGWLILYSYIENYFHGDRVFSVEAALLDRDNPAHVIKRTESILVPEESYERYGVVPNIVFPTSMTLDEHGMLDLWYGGADTVCAKASVRLHDLLRALDPAKPARTFTRAQENPILTPRGSGFESRDVFNAAAVDLEGTVYILYRAMDSANTSTIGLACSRDGIHIDERLEAPVYVPRAEFEQKKGSPTGNSGCEDPRVSVIGDTLYMTYTAYDGVHAPAGALTTISIKDFLARRFDAWTMPVLLTPDAVDDKDLALLPKVVDGNYLLYHRVNSLICADLLPELRDGKRVSRCIEVMGPRYGMWDGEKIGTAGPPIPVGDKWLMIYHGVSRHKTYRLGAALLDSDGTTLLARTADAIFEPQEPYELEGEIANVVFSCGSVVRGDTLYLYYGGADRVIGVATASVSHLMDALS